MRAEIRAVMMRDGSSFEAFIPEEADSFEAEIDLQVGPKGSPGSDSFTLTVMTPKHMQNVLQEDDVRFMHSTMIVSKWNTKIILKHVHRIIANVDEENWALLVKKLEKYFAWEFAR